MDADKANSYWQAITEIEAQAALVQLRIADYPWMKTDDKESTHRHFHRLAYPKSHDGEVIQTADLAERLHAAING